MKIKLTLAIFLVALFAAGCTHNSITQNTGEADDDGQILNNTQNDDQAENQMPDPEDSEISDNAVLDLKNQGLERIPEDVLDRRSLKKLDLSGNSISSLPSEIGRLVNLEEFYIENNELTGALPAEIRMMSKLKILDASGNGLTGIPAEIGQLDNLAAIDLSSNNIDTYPNELFNLTNLEILNISDNPFSEESISAIKNGLPNTLVITE